MLPFGAYDTGMIIIPATLNPSMIEGCGKMEAWSVINSGRTRSDAIAKMSPRRVVLAAALTKTSPLVDALAPTTPLVPF